MSTDQTRQQDEEFLIDRAVGQHDPGAAEPFEKRLDEEADLQKLDRDIQHTLAALKALPEFEPPASLTAETMQRIARHRRTEALIAQAELAPRPASPTFTWREGAAVAAAVLLMASIFVPSMQRARDNALARQCLGQTGQLGSAMTAYANENDGYFPAAQGSAWWLNSGQGPAVSNSSAMFKLVKDGMADPGLFQCPAGSGGSFVVTSGMTDFPSPRFVGYDYQHSVGGSAIRRSDPAYAGYETEMAILADSNPLFVGGRSCTEPPRASHNHDGQGQSVLYLDGHAQWSTTAAAGVAGDNIYLADKITEYRGNETPASPIDSFLLPAWSNGN
jgi:hypothetical protein